MRTEEELRALIEDAKKKEHETEKMGFHNASNAWMLTRQAYENVLNDKEEK